MTVREAVAVEKLDRSKTRFVDVDGIRTRIYEDGAGETLVLIHGGQYGFISGLDIWSLNLDDLAKQFHVIAIDKLGQGHTDNPRRDEEYTVEALLAHTLRLFEVLGIQRAHLVGHSRGGFLASSLAIQRPELVEKLVIVDSNSTSPAKEGSGDFYHAIDRAKPAGPPTRASMRLHPDAQAFSKWHISEDYLDRALEIARLPKTIEAQEKMKTLADRVWFSSFYAARDRLFAALDERGFPMPVLIVWGNNDLPAPLRQGLQLWDLVAAKTPQAEFHVLNQAGHHSFREQPAAFHRLIQSFCG